jgi:lysophospholipase L1-like esterase
LTYYSNQNNKQSGVVNYALGGGQLCWSGEDYPMYTGNDSNPVDITTYDGAILAGFSCSQSERAAAIEYYSDVDRWTKGGTYVGLTSASIANAETNHYENICYDNSLLGNLDADLFIFGTYGINDRPGSRLTFTDDDGNTCKTSTIRNDGLYRFDRRTIFGAYNYVLRALYQANPNAKVVILGQHTRQWGEQDIVNGLQMSVAYFWQIPFADWGNYLPLNDTFKGATYENVNNSAIQRTFFQTDQVHLAAAGAKLLGEWVADWITKTELKPLNPRWGLE